MKVGLIGPSYTMRPASFDAQRCVNLFPVMDETHQGKDVAALYGTPGLIRFSKIGVGPIRGVIDCGNSRAFVVSGNQFYELFADGSFTAHGSISTYTGYVSMEENSFQICLATGPDGYIFAFAQNIELVGDTTFETTNAWTLGTGWTVAGNGSAVASSASAALSQVISVSSTIAYTVKYKITATGGTITPILGGTTGTARTASGTYTETIIAGTDSTGIVFNTSGFSGTVTSVSVQQTTDQFVQITATGWPGANYVTFQDSYFIVNKPDTGQFYISGNYDGTAWNALDFATAETGPDNLVAPFSAYGQLWLFGVDTIEIWYNSGAQDFPFQRMQGGKMESGCAARFSIAKADNSIFWVGQDKYGKGIVYRAQGITPSRISTQAIEYALAKAGDLSGLVGYCYQQEGHLFYVLTGGNLQTTLVYDAATQLWHERAYLSAGVYQQHRGVFHFYAFGKNLTGDRVDGRLYQISMDTYTDDGDLIRRSRTFTHINEEGQRFKFKYLQVDFESGVGLPVGQGSDPTVTLQISGDGANTWSSEYPQSFGKVGEYRKRVVWRRIGQYRQLTFRINISDPVPVIICGAYLE